MNIIFNELRHDVYTTSKIKHTCHFFITYYFYC